MRKILLVLALTAIAWPIAARSQVIVRPAPSRIIVEAPLPPPSSRYVWTPGYDRWIGTRYIWVPGRYVLPPRRGVVWVAPRWVPHDGTWVFVAGHWR